MEPTIDEGPVAEGHVVTPEEAGTAGESDAHVQALTEESGAGMPQLDPEYYGNLIFWLVLSLVAIYLVLSRVAIPRLATILSVREGSIGGDLAAAESLRAQAREAEAAYERALAAARAEAGRIANGARAEIRADLDAELARADARISERSAESARALGQIEAEAAASVEAVARDAARAIVAALGGQVDEGAIDGAVGARTGGA